VIYITGIIGSEKEKNQIGLVDVISMVKDDTNSIIEITINSPGGCSDTGFSIYKFLKEQTRPVYTYSQKQCDSIASIIFCAGEKRFAGCDMTIHNPAFECLLGRIEVSDLIDLTKILEETKQKATNIYKETTNIDDETLSRLMDVETLISPEEAVKIGFATDIDIKIKPILLYEKNNLKKGKMEEELKKLQESQNKILMFLEKLGIKKKSPKMMTLISVNGTEIELEKEVGEPQVGDIASPVGEWLMPNGETIVIEDVEGITKITEIKQKNPDEGEEMKKMKIQIEELKSENEKLKANMRSSVNLLEESEKSISEIKEDYERLKLKEKTVSMYTPEERERKRVSSFNESDEYFNKRMEELKERRPKK
jgi:ATP-dependent Clp protease protease subunit